MDTLQTIHGHPTDTPRDARRMCVGRLWVVRGMSWVVRGSPMVCPWGVRGVFAGHPWVPCVVRGTPIVTHEPPPIDHPWSVRGASVMMGCLWIARRSPMGLSWVVREQLMDCS